MNYLEFIIAVFVGELILCSFYIYFGGAIMNLMH